MGRKLIEIQNQVNRPLEDLEEKASGDSADFLTSCALLLGYVRANRIDDARDLHDELVTSETASLQMTTGTSNLAEALEAFRASGGEGGKPLAIERLEQLEILRDAVTNLEKILVCRQNLESKPDDPSLQFDLGVALCCTGDTANHEDRWIYTELGWFDEANYIFTSLHEKYPDHDGVSRGLEVVRNEQSLIRRRSR
ncbi:hypothetical protein KBA41_10150 [Candidatus Ozemobacteraceae bacterium]|nr:hypothetical protein [Candidatus Ozemobacteraceae bacterium]